jgi:Tol biopolymer transport system component
MSDRTGTQDVWFVRVDGGRPQGDPQLLKPGIGRVGPMGITSHGALFFGITGGRTDVYEAGIDPQTGKIISPAKKAALLNEGNNAYPDYSPDGKQLAYISTQSMPTIQSQRFLGILSLETGQVRELRPDLAAFSYPRWAPDGHSISVEGSGRDGRKGIYRVDVHSGDFVPVVLIDKGKEIYSHRWSKDGKRLFYAVGEENGKTASLIVHDLESGREEPLSGAPSDAMDIDISPDGKELALLNRFGRRAVRVMPTSGGSPREITSFEHGERSVISPAWSADGHYVYFFRLQGTSELGANVMDLYRISANGGEPQKLDLAMVRFRHFSVHPDGRHIAFSSMGANPAQSQVWVMENFLPKDKTKK